MPKSAAAERIGRECLGMPVRMLHRAVSAVYDEALSKHGIGIAQLNLLVAVELLGEQAGPSLVTRVLMLEKSSVSREIDRLLERGWVTRRASREGRGQRLKLTLQGRRMIEAALPSWEAAQVGVRDLLGDVAADQLLSMADQLRAQESSGRPPRARPISKR